jgi:hypothetical protein
MLMGFKSRSADTWKVLQHAAEAKCFDEMPKCTLMIPSLLEKSSHKSHRKIASTRNTGAFSFATIFLIERWAPSNAL